MAGVGRGRAAVLPAWMQNQSVPGSAPMRPQSTQQRDLKQSTYSVDDGPEEGEVQPNASQTYPPHAAVNAPAEGRGTKRPRDADKTYVEHNQDSSLPEGWYSAFDNHYQREYYYKPDTGERTWIKPLPPGWTQATDPTTGKPYYFNVGLNLTQWDYPADVAPRHVVVRAGTTTATGAEASFIASSTWQGKKTGYAFKNGAQGQGYYIDRTPSSATRAAPPRRTDSSAAPGPQTSNRREDSRDGGHGRGPGRGRDRSGNALDPMDPSSYSDAPRGRWGAGLETSQNE